LVFQKAIRRIPKSKVAGKLEKLAWTFEPDYVHETMHFAHKRLGLPSVLVHGDLWASNLLFPKDSSKANGGGDEVAAFIDWQLTHPGSVCEDLGRILLSSCSAAMRRRHLREVLGGFLAQE
jgi:aminoglycoside phosphotransferase (APT) family kinase protein